MMAFVEAIKQSCLMKYSAGLANTVVVGGNGFQAGERASECGPQGLLGQRKVWGVRAGGTQGLEPRAEGCLSTTPTLVESYQRMRVHVCVPVRESMCPCGYKGASDSFRWETFF